MSKGTIDDINDLLSLSEVVENLGLLQQDNLIDEPERNSIIIEDNLIDEPERNSIIIDEEIEEDINCLQYIINSVFKRCNSKNLN